MNTGEAGSTAAGNALRDLTIAGGKSSFGIRIDCAAQLAALAVPVASGTWLYPKIAR